MAQKINRDEFNRDLNRYVGKVSKSDTRFINLKEFMKKDKTQKKPKEKFVESKDHDVEPELIELKEKTGLSLYWSNFLNFFKSDDKEDKEPDEIDDAVDVTDEITETEEHMIEEEDEIPVHKSSPSFFERLFGKTENNHEEEALKQINEELLKDIKSVSVLAKDLLELIPDEELENLKIDGTLDEFKNILKKNNLLKKK